MLNLDSSLTREQKQSFGRQLPQSSSSSSWVWLSGAKCTPIRLPLAIVFTFRRIGYRLRMVPPKTQDFVIWGLLAGGAFAVYATLAAVQMVVGSVPDTRHWAINLFVNILGYATVFLPGYLVIRYVRHTNFLERNGQKCMDGVVRLFVYGNDEGIDDAITFDAQKSEAAKRVKSEAQKALTLFACFVGLMVSYLTWGILQEKIMTRQYTDSAGNTGQFKDSQFLVFVNRILAFAVALLYITFSRQPRHKAPMYKYSYCSLTNVMSSWFQYEALKFVSFPTQVLAKASKIIPVMIMGKIVSSKKYETYEYIVALMISMGMVLFLFGSQEDRSDNSPNTTFSGVLLLVGYMGTDSFTSNWQNELFTAHGMSSVQMMCGVNLFSCLLTLSSLLQQGAFYTSLVFMSQFPAFTFDCVILSMCSAVGQLFIYYTIAEFGAVTFIIIMTLRQAMAIILSCITYHHAISVMGMFGVLVVFGAMFLKIYCGQRLKRLKAAQQKAGVSALPSAVQTTK